MHKYGSPQNVMLYQGLLHLSRFESQPTTKLVTTTRFKVAWSSPMCWPCGERCMQSWGRVVDPFTRKSSSRNIVCYFHSFESNLGMKRNFTKYLKEICCLSSNQHFSFKCFPKNAFVGEIFPKLSGLFWPL